MNYQNSNDISVLNGNNQGLNENHKPNASNSNEWDSLPIPMTFRTSLVEHAKARAVDSMALHPKQADINALIEHAEAMAEEAGRNAFDVEKNLSDKLQSDEFDRNLIRRDDLRQKFSEAGRQFHAQCQDLASLGNLEQQPGLISMSTKILLGLLVGTTIILTIHDFVFDFDSQLLSWLLSGIFAFLLGLAVVWVETKNLD